jgi:hypothetical protein
MWCSMIYSSSEPSLKFYIIDEGDGENIELRLRHVRQKQKRFLRFYICIFEKPQIFGVKFQERQKTFNFSEKYNILRQDC